MDDKTFLRLIRNKIGSGNQGIVYNFGDNKDDLVIKKWIKTEKTEKTDNDNDIIHEYTMAKLAGDIGCGPKIYDFRKIEGVYYMLMEKVKPIKLKQEDLKNVIKLFDKLIKAGIINFDGSFGKTIDGKLVIFDYGVSKKSSNPLKEGYCGQDYFWSFKDFYNIDGLYEHYCKENLFGKRKRKRSKKRSKQKK